MTATGRERVLTVIRESLTPLPAHEVSRLSGLPHQHAKNTISRLIKEMLIINVGRSNAGLYAMADPRAKKAKLAKPLPVYESRVPTESYTPGPGLPMRPGALQFLEYPHLINGERVERVRPVIISAQPERMAFK